MIRHTEYPIYKSYLKPLLFWDEIQESIIKKYTLPKKFIKNMEINEIDELLNKQIKNYNKMTKRNLEETLKFLFNNYREFLFFSVRDNNVNGYYIYRYDYDNNWAQDLKTYNNQDFKKFYYDYLKKLRRPFMKYDDKSKWYSNNCILSMTDYSRKYGLNESYIKEIIDMINYTKKKFNGLPDCDFIVNRKDFPLLTLDKTPSYSNLYDKTKKMDQPDNPWIICSQCKTENHYDINFPTTDEWNFILRPQDVETDWSKKYPTAIWRGKSTGCGVTIKNNNRLKLADISHKWKSNNNYNQNNEVDKTPYLDVGISQFVKRLKVTNQIIYYLNPKDLDFYISKFMDYKDQSYCKYWFNIEGNASAYRFGTIFSLNSVVINIKSKYYLWFEPLLTKNEFVEIEEDFNEGDIAKTIRYLKENDDKAEDIANNGRNFYKKYINKGIISEYWFKLMMKINDLQI